MSSGGLPPIVFDKHGVGEELKHLGNSSGDLCDTSLVLCGLSEALASIRRQDRNDAMPLTFKK